MGREVGWIRHQTLLGRLIARVVDIARRAGQRQIYGIDIFPDGDVVVCGRTESQDFPISPGAFQTALAGGSSEDAFLARLDSAGSILEYSTYFGGSGDDGAGKVHIDASGLMTVVGGPVRLTFRSLLERSTRVSTH